MQDPTEQLYGLDGGGVTYRADSSSVTVYITEHRDAAAAAALVQAIGEVTSECSYVEHTVRLDEATAAAIAQAVDVPATGVVAQAGSLNRGSDDGPGTPFQDNQRAVVSVGDGRLVVVTTATPHGEQRYDLVQLTRTVLDGVRAVEGVADSPEIRNVLDD